MQTQPWFFTQRMKVPFLTVLSQLGLSVMQLPPIYYGMFLPVLSFPLSLSKTQVSRIPACFSNNYMGLQETVVEQADCLD